MEAAGPQLDPLLRDRALVVDDQWEEPYTVCWGLGLSEQYVFSFFLHPYVRRSHFCLTVHEGLNAQA